MIRFFLTTLAVIFTTFLSLPCTNLLVGKKASADGSVLISYAADSYSLYGELYHWPARQYRPGEMLKVHEWDTGKYLGEIPQVLQTYNVTGNMNEY
ncbi:MAG: C69 family dipeptidase, partial [Proteiniphilum sp.]|nr:C69 family dipeptidase [Proteiniphilum sp.]